MILILQLEIRKGIQMNKKVVVTGGGGFIGSYLSKRFCKDGWDVTVIDNLSRGDTKRFGSFSNEINFIDIDIRDQQKVTKVVEKAELVMHLAAINGTENFYKNPELVLDVGIRGALAVVNACKLADVPDLVVASSAEVYQTPPLIPTPEDVPLMLPDSWNPRYSYGGSKIISELIAFNYARDHFRKLQIFRPHNIYGEDMGWKHVIPQFIEGALNLKKNGKSLDFTIQGDGLETRAFCYIDDVIEGILTMYKKGSHREIYHIGNDEEISIYNLISLIGSKFDLNFNIKTSDSPEGSTRRRKPDITKMKGLGYCPKVSLSEGLDKTIIWYSLNEKPKNMNSLM